MKKAEVDTMTLQEAIDYAMEKIVFQGAPCVSRSGHNCAYGNGDMHCAVGWLLDENNNELMHFEGSVSEMADMLEYENIPDIILNNTTVFDKLQVIHDVARKESYKRPDTAKRQLKEALEYLKEAGVNTRTTIWKKWFEIINTSRGEKIV